MVAHLTGLSRIYPPRIMRALQDDASPDAPSRRRLGTGQIDPTVEGDQALLLRQELGDQLLAEFIKSNHAIDHALAQAGPQDWDKLVYRTVGTESLRNLIDVFITERTIHGWDIRSQFELRASLSPACVPIIVERIPQRPRWWSFSTAAGFSPFPLRYRFAMTQPVPYVVDVVVTEEQQYLEVASQDEAHVTIRCSGDTFILLMYGRIQPDLPEEGF